jgi:hypothetical protein
MTTTENTIYTRRYSPTNTIVPPVGTITLSESATSRIDFHPISLELMLLNEGTQIPNSFYTFQHQLLTKLHSSKDGYLIQSAFVDEDGYGTTFNEAYMDFLGSIRDRYNSMQSRESRLATYELQILNNIRTLLESI